MGPAALQTPLRGYIIILWLFKHGHAQMWPETAADGDGFQESWSQKVQGRSWEPDGKKCCSYESFQQIVDSDKAHKHSQLCSRGDKTSGRKWSTCSRQCVAYDNRKCLRAQRMHLQQCPDADCQQGAEEWSSWSECRRVCVRFSCYGDNCNGHQERYSTRTSYLHSCEPDECKSQSPGSLESLSGHVRPSEGKSPCRATCFRSRFLQRHCREGCRTIRVDVAPCRCAAENKRGAGGGGDASPYEQQLEDFFLMSEALREKHNRMADFGPIGGKIMK